MEASLETTVATSCRVCFLPGFVFRPAVSISLNPPNTLPVGRGGVAVLLSLQLREESSLSPSTHSQVAKPQVILIPKAAPQARERWPGSPLHSGGLVSVSQGVSLCSRP